MNYIFHPEARQEVQKATHYYKDIDTRLGILFRKEIDKAISNAMNHPKAWQKIAPGVRRCLTNRFPYSVLYNYREKEQAILIIAVMSNHRKPRYWKQRF